MIKIKRTHSSDPDFLTLVGYLDADLAEKDGDEHSFYAKFNQVDSIQYAVVAYEDGKPVGCGAIKEYSGDTMEVKRMFTQPASRGKGIASQILHELETWAKELSFTKCILETGKRQPEAISLYKKNGYDLTGNYGQYAGVENSLCFKKDLQH